LIYAPPQAETGRVNRDNAIKTGLIARVEPVAWGIE
jgi:hypothetical protein